MRIIFAGTPEFAAVHLDALLATDHDIVAVYTQPDRPAGRGKKIQASAVKQLALANGLAVEQPESLKSSDAVETLANYQADVMVVVAYGLILPLSVLNTPRYGCINVHGSILPRWRGAAPIQRAIWAGDNETGVTIMQMDEGLDTGDILNIATLPISGEETSASLYQKLAQLGPSALVESLQDFTGLTAVKQDEAHANYAKKLSKAEAQLDWSLRADQLERNIRAFNPWPVAYIAHQQGPIKVWEASVESNQQDVTPGTILSADKTGITVACQQGSVRLTVLQVPGKKAMSVADILNARRDWFAPGTVLP